MADTITIAELPKVTSLASTDLIEIDRNGAGAAVTYANLVSSLSTSLGVTGVREVLELIIG
ncbi:hypothetical protein [uncultured Alistipes sp.]|uniref:hypothetical protein n=1 Tax=uncultured Alistipes sp. TaxID=538949 RepID=UPI00258F0E4D|nr:hypothetical protein [uncultured Alistipes sp.]